MKKTLLQLGVIFFGLGMLLSGMQTVTGYYADPSGYGFHHLASAYLNISLAITVFGLLVMVFLIRRVGRRFL